MGCFSYAYAFAHGCGLGEVAEAYCQHVGSSGWAAGGLEYPYRDGAGHWVGGGLGIALVAWQVGSASAGFPFGFGG